MTVLNDGLAKARNVTGDHAIAGAVREERRISDGLFQADPRPEPGKFLILAGDRIAFIEFGMVGRVSQLRRRQIITLLQALLQNSGGRPTLPPISQESDGSPTLFRMDPLPTSMLYRFRRP